MRVKHSSHYYFNTKHGFSGNLAADPVFGTTQNGQAYAKMTVYCSQRSTSDDPNQRTLTRDKKTVLKAYVCVYDATLLDHIDHVAKKGCFVNIGFENITLALAEDDDSGALHVSALVTANRLEVKYTPTVKTTASKRSKVTTHSDSTRDQHPKATRSYRQQ